MATRKSTFSVATPSTSAGRKVAPAAPAAIDLPCDIADLLDGLPCLDGRERRILKALIAGQTLRPLGRALGLSQEGVRKAGERAVRKIAQALRPGCPVVPGAIGRFQALLREEHRIEWRIRAQLTTPADLTGFTMPRTSQN